MKCIFVIAEDGDSSVNEVLQWIKYYSNIKIVRINDRDRLNIIDISISDERSSFSIRVNNDLHIVSDDIQSYWYRRGELNYNSIYYKKDLREEPLVKELYESLNQYYKDEWKHITDFIHFNLKNDKNIKSLNSYFDIETNKMSNLELAKRAGLLIPDSIISNSIETIASFLKKHPKVITKPVRLPGAAKNIKTGTMHYSQSTNLFSINDLKELTDNDKIFQPTLFQEYIEKDFEIRTFYLKGKMYSMAIFSQRNERTQIDFRNYDDKMPNRNVPFKLPSEIENKLHNLMISLGYDTGSFDIIYHNGQYVFLEVNTVGQFEWVSKWCNHFIEKELALEILN